MNRPYILECSHRLNGTSKNRFNSQAPINIPTMIEQPQPVFIGCRVTARAIMANICTGHCST